MSTLGLYCRSIVIYHIYGSVTVIYHIYGSVTVIYHIYGSVTIGQVMVVTVSLSPPVDSYINMTGVFYV